MTGRPKSTPASFWSKIDVRGEDECWNWTRSLRNGYGHHSVNKKDVYAHRYAWHLSTGESVSGRMNIIMHKCNNKLCCNPKHLELGTPKQNSNDAYRDGLSKSGMSHPSTKISSDVVAKIRADNRPQTILAKLYGVSQPHISSIKRNAARRYDGDPHAS